MQRVLVTGLGLKEIKCNWESITSRKCAALTSGDLCELEQQEMLKEMGLTFPPSSLLKRGLAVSMRLPKEGVMECEDFSSCAGVSVF